MTFVPRQVNLTFHKGQGPLGESGTVPETVSGLRVSCMIERGGGSSMAQAQVRVYGMSLSDMLALSALNVKVNQYDIMAVRKNTLIISAGDAVNGMSQIFEGQIMIGQIDMNAQPDVALTVIANEGLFEAIQPASPISYPNTMDVATVMQSLATSMGLNFEGNGVNVKLPRSYIHGTYRDQVMQIADAAMINWTIENGTLAIWSRGSFRSGTPATLSPTTGMVGYPTYSEMGISVRTLFNPNIRFGALVKVEGSQMKYANGPWSVYRIQHELESQTPGGAWFTTFDGMPASFTS
jgi:hypothetical protein